MRTLKKIVDKIMEFASVAIMTLMVLLVAWQVIARYFLGNPSTFSEMLTRYLFVWLVLITATYVFGKRDHMCITFLKDKLPAAIKSIVDILIEVVNIIFSLTVMTAGGFAVAKMQMVQEDATLHIAMGLVYAVIPVCGLVTTFYCLCNLMENIRERQNITGQQKAAEYNKEKRKEKGGKTK